MDGQEGGGGDAALGELFEHQHRVEPGKARAADIFVNVEAGKSEARRLADHVHRKVFLFIPLGREGPQFLGRKVCGRLPNQGLFTGQFGGHAVFSVQSFSRNSLVA